MSILTNNYNLPQPLVDAVKADSYEVSGDISTTTLISPPQVRMLKKQFGRDIEEDVSEYLWALLGTAVHGILERSHIKDVRKRAFLMVIETLKDECKTATKKEQEDYTSIAKKLFILIDKFFPEIKGRYIYEMKLHYDLNGFVLSGKFDLYDIIEKCLYDYKVCSVYAYMYPESRKTWTIQLNVYAFMLRNEGYEVNDLKIVAIFRDWSASRGLNNPDYPKKQFITIPLTMYSQEDVKKSIDRRMELHREAEISGVVPECSGEERWASTGTFNVKKKGLKRRIAGLASEAMASEYIRENKHKYPPESIYLEIVPGESKKCASYCSVRSVCPQKAREDKRILKETEQA